MSFGTKVAHCGAYDGLLGIAYNEDGSGMRPDTYADAPLFGIYNTYNRAGTDLGLVAPLTNNGIIDVLVTRASSPPSVEGSTLSSEFVSITSLTASSYTGITYIRFKIRLVTEDGVVERNVDMDFSENNVTLSF